MTAHEVDV
jgi:hypothetical protein